MKITVHKMRGDFFLAFYIFFKRNIGARQSSDIIKTAIPPALPLFLKLHRLYESVLSAMKIHIK